MLTNDLDPYRFISRLSHGNEKRPYYRPFIIYGAGNWTLLMHAPETRKGLFMRFFALPNLLFLPLF